eukprot:CAMPEP_0172363352 /NCGR_PEP_ID=MMETSP1060-20121228/6740_1 /TAXON_ID=37318 /ORGANISM="Pseudo-nitzschia pungens, Strain cf. cingulata" /LENGTH=449 /DNA_ID=CAMNT_0013086079 /DNA_START=475 /DNA_END=1824 /DNA_ORIENTATION=+
MSEQPNFSTPSATAQQSSGEQQQEEEPGFSTPSATLADGKDEAIIGNGILPEGSSGAQAIGSNDFTYQTPDASLQASPTAPYSNNVALVETSVGPPFEPKMMVLFFLGALVGILFASIGAFHFGRKRRQNTDRRILSRSGMHVHSFKHKSHRKARRQSAEYSTDERWSDDSSANPDTDFGFHDEPTDLERGRRRRRKKKKKKKQRSKNQTNAFGGNNDWLGGVGFEESAESDEDSSIDDENVEFEDNLIEDHHDRSKHDSDKDGSFNAIVNNSLSDDSSSKQAKSAPPMAVVKRQSLMSDENLSSRWKRTVGSDASVGSGATNDTPSGTDGTSVANDAATDASAAKPPTPIATSFENIQKEQESLNASLYKLNDQLVHQQRELEQTALGMTTKTTRRKHKEHYQQHKQISDKIAELESQKEEISQKLKLIQKEIKAQRRERRRKLFQEP